MRKIKKKYKNINETRKKNIKENLNKKKKNCQSEILF